MILPGSFSVVFVLVLCCTKVEYVQVQFTGEASSKYPEMVPVLHRICDRFRIASLWIPNNTVCAIVKCFSLHYNYSIDPVFLISKANQFSVTFV